MLLYLIDGFGEVAPDGLRRAAGDRRCLVDIKAFPDVEVKDKVSVGMLPA